MACEEIERLREQATRIKSRLNEQRRKARAHATEARVGRPSGTSDYIPYLRRKLNRLAYAIELHVAEHKCQE